MAAVAYTSVKASKLYYDSERHRLSKAIQENPVLQREILIDIYERKGLTRADAHRIVTELTAFVDVARGATPSPCSVADALEAFRTAEACVRSMVSGEPVDLASIPTVRAELSVRA